MAKEETYSTEGPICPHCGRQYTADEPHYYDESGFEIECDGQTADGEDCGKTFKVEVYTQTSWTCSPLPVPATPSP